MNFVSPTIALLLLGLLAACGSVPNEPPTRKTQVPVHEASLSADGGTLTLRFVGGAPFDGRDPCTHDYVAVLKRTVDELRFSVFQQPHPADPDGKAVCDLLGYRRSLDVKVDPPFTGHRLVDTSSDGLVVEVKPVAT